MTIAILLIILGFALILAEVVFIPGTTFVGFTGAAACITGIVKIYLQMGSFAGNTALAASIVLFGLLFFLLLRFNVWKGMALNSKIESRVNEHILDTLHTGDTGTTQSALRPVGKAIFGDTVYEVQSMGQYLNAGIKVRIIQISQLKIFVEPIEQV